MNLKQQYDAIRNRMKELRTIGRERDFTDAEMKEANDLFDQSERLEKEIEKNDEIADKLKSINADRDDEDSDDDGDDDDDDRHRIPLGGKSLKTGFLPAQGKSFDQLARRIAKQVQANGRKSIDVETITPVTLNTDPIPMDKPAGNLLALIPVVQRGTVRFDWLQQTARTNNAKIVAPGALKPTSQYDMESRGGRLRVLAHTSSPFDKYLLADSPWLGQFIGNELLYGLYSELERQIIAGTGDGSDDATELKGLLGTSGIRQQGFATDRIVTTRKAVTQLEKIGVTSPAGSYWVMSPDDWEALELSRTADGHLELGSPVNVAAKQLWSRPVVTVPGLEFGAGFLVGPGATQLNTDLQGIETLWFAQHNDDAFRNQLRARCEGRFEFVVPLPGHIVNLDLVAG
ncbi:phage major capsid protein [Rhodococcoides fascians A25f]|uniref:phage major capsid protein n=1 Tax=Rhodococcoides fascians TaxID=1828 RepID=UPI000562FB1C|nr:phage major capsid protein [Rhodococcus fascians]QII04359.1 phage major capsid protein [Rhodococcus fascians A25f]